MGRSLYVATPRLLGEPATREGGRSEGGVRGDHQQPQIAPENPAHPEAALRVVSDLFSQAA
jgi:hypothetical protein